MTSIRWDRPDAAPDPFAAMVGDRREYLVRVCYASDVPRDGWRSVFVAFLEEVLETTRRASNGNSRRLVFEIDPVYAIMNCIVTDQMRRRDERDVYKLSAPGWQDEIDAVDAEDEAAYDAACDEIFRRFHSELTGAVADPRLATARAALEAEGFSFWTATYTLSSEWEDLTPLFDEEP